MNDITRRLHGMNPDILALFSRTSPGPVSRGRLPLSQGYAWRK
ncbi:MAG: hypothetical protein P4N24_03245 [Acidobacteriota bacterium]|nr:hypothetical protein [Acidobacteriota bacterium]